MSAHYWKTPLRTHKKEPQQAKDVQIDAKKRPNKLKRVYYSSHQHDYTNHSIRPNEKLWFNQKKSEFVTSSQKNLSFLTVSTLKPTEKKPNGKKMISIPWRKLRWRICNLWKACTKRDEIFFNIWWIERDILGYFPFRPTIKTKNTLLIFHKRFFWIFVFLMEMIIMKFVLKMYVVGREIGPNRKFSQNLILAF